MDRRKFIANTGFGIAGIALLNGSKDAIGQILIPSQYAPTTVALAKINPIDHGKALVNPDMGWTMHFYPNRIKNYGSQLEPSDTLDDFPGLSTVYLRIVYLCGTPGWNSCF